MNCVNVVNMAPQNSFDIFSLRYSESVFVQILRFNNEFNTNTGMKPRAYLSLQKNV